MEPTHAPTSRVAVTATCVPGLGATACQISATPGWELARATGVHCSPPPVTDVKRWASQGPSEANMATTNWLGRLVEIGGALNVVDGKIWSALMILSSETELRDRPDDVARAAVVIPINARMARMMALRAMAVVRFEIKSRFSWSGAG